MAKVKERDKVASDEFQDMFYKQFEKLLKEGLLDKILKDAGFQRSGKDTGASSSASSSPSSSPSASAGTGILKNKVSTETQKTSKSISEATPGLEQKKTNALSNSFGWKIQESKKSVQASGGDILDPPGWNVPVLESKEGLSVESTGVILLSTAEAKELMHLRAEKPLALLTPSPVEENVTSIPVLVKDKNGKVASRRRFLHQLGKNLVTYSCNAPTRNIPNDTVKIVFCLKQGISSEEVWKLAATDPKRTIANWLQTVVNTRCIDMSRPSAQGSMMKIIARIPKDKRLDCLKQSGQGGIFVNAFLESEADKLEFSIIPLDQHLGLSEALSTAKFHPECIGVVTTHQTLAIRVRAEDHAPLTQKIHGDSAGKYLGTFWEISGLPQSTGPEALKTFVKPWKVNPVRAIRRGRSLTWIVRAEDPPPATILQHEEGIALIQRAEQRKQRPQERMVWSPNQERLPHKFHQPQSWTSVVTGGAKLVPKEDVPANKSTYASSAILEEQEVVPGKAAPSQEQPANSELGKLIAAELAKATQAFAETLRPMQNQIARLSREVEDLKGPVPMGEEGEEPEWEEREPGRHKSRRVGNGP